MYLMNDMNMSRYQLEAKVRQQAKGIWAPLLTTIHQMFEILALLTLDINLRPKENNLSFKVVIQIL